MAAQHKARCVLRSYRSGTEAASPLLLGSVTWGLDRGQQRAASGLDSQRITLTHSVIQ